MHQILEQIEADVNSRPSPMEFEIVYQARVAIDRIKFAIKQTEQFAPHTDPIREAGLQLLDGARALGGGGPPIPTTVAVLGEALLPRRGTELPGELTARVPSLDQQMGNGQKELAYERGACCRTATAIR
jgi:hypothetical protein